MSNDGIEIAVQIRDLDDRQDNDAPTYVAHRQRVTSAMLAASSNRDLVESAMEMSVREVVDTWRENREVPDDQQQSGR